MPIYMDRHDLPGITATQVAEQHRQDLRVQDRYDCRGLTYWFDEKRGTAFCLFEAPNRDAVERLHEDSHGVIPKEIIEVEGSVVEAFLGRIEDPDTAQKADGSNLSVFEDPAFRAIMVTELKNAAFLRARPAHERDELLRTHNELIQDAIERHVGREVRQTANGFMASFASAPKGVECAIEIRNGLVDRNRQHSNTDPEVAIGISAGDPVAAADSFFGEVISLARRLCSIAGSGQIMLSSALKDHYKQLNPQMTSESHGIKTLNPMEERFLNQLMDTTERTCSDEAFDVDAFCREMGLSRPQLYRKTTSLTGQSPNEFMREFRLNRALELIERKQDNISQIAFAAGFGSPSYFSRCFRRRFGVLPSELANAVE